MLTLLKRRQRMGDNLQHLLLRQKQVLKSRLGAGQRVAVAFQIERWLRETEAALLMDGVSPKVAKRKAGDLTFNIFQQLRAGEPVERVYDDLLRRAA